MANMRIYNDGVDSRSWKNLKRRLERLPDRLDRLVSKTAGEARRNVIRSTPKKWTGQTRRAWLIHKKAPMHYVVKNDNPVMRFLEYGTKAHGPKTAKFLYVPLRRTGFNAYLTGNFSKLKFGKDYVLTKRVRGIRAMRIARNEQRQVNLLLASRISRMVDSTIY